MSKEIILYDLARKGSCTSWSGNVWKTRLVLSYKKIPYDTEWVTHATITDVLKDVVHTKNATGSPYTVPTIKLSDGTAVMESRAIAQALETSQPEPSLHLNPELLDEVSAIMQKVGGAMIPNFMPRVAREVIIESSVPAFKASREKMLGMPLDDFEKAKGGERAWDAAAPGLRELSEFLTKHKKDEGPFTLGSQVSYMDFWIVATLEGMRRIGQDLFDRLVAFDRRFGELHEACKPWMNRDD